MGSRGLVVALAFPLLLASCGVDEEPASTTAAAFVEALRDQDGAAACELLAPQAVDSLESGGTSCPEAVLEVEVPSRPVSDTEVWGQEAQVRFGDEAVFLHEFTDGWRVTAAGCTPRKDRPYDCDVEA